MFAETVSRPAIASKIEIGGFDTPFAIAQGYSTTDILQNNLLTAVGSVISRQSVEFAAEG